MTTKEREEELVARDQELIAVGASVASGCLPCTKFHIRAAAASGASETEIHEAVRIAEHVRRVATTHMVRAAGLAPVEADLPMPHMAEIGGFLAELVSISAAYALCCSTSLKASTNRARTLGATDRQLFEAIRIACAIRDVAGQKARAVAANLLGVEEEEKADCGCGGNDTGPNAPSTCGPEGDEVESESCHCRS